MVRLPRMTRGMKNLGEDRNTDVVKDVGAEWGDEGERVVVKVRDAGNVAEEIPFDKLLLGNPKLLTAVVDDCVLVRVTVDGEGTGGGGEEVGEDVG